MIFCGRKLKFLLLIAIVCFVLLLLRVIVYRTDLGVELGSKIYLTCSHDVPVERTIDIVAAADDGYIQNTAAMMASALLNCDSTSQFRFHILDGGISQEKKDRLAKLKELRPFDLFFYDMTKFDWSIFPNNRDYITLATFYRLAIVEVLPSCLDKALYLDGDIIVEQDLKELWDVDIQNNVVAAVEDEESYTNSKRLGLSGNYFNAGVLLLDLGKLRKENLFKASVAYLKENYRKVIYQDQDILNGLFDGKCKFLPLKWNVNTCMFCKRQVKHYYTDAEVEIYRRKPGIIHFTGKNGKPWCLFNSHPFAYEYWNYLKYTDFYKITKRLLLPF